MTVKKDYTYCPECDSRIRLRTPRLGQRVQCRECGTPLEVIDLHPLELDWAYDDSAYDDPEPRANNRPRNASYYFRDNDPEY